jgi:alanine racemase
VPQHPTTRFDAPAPRPTHLAWVEVDLGALIDNARELRRAIPPSTRLGLLVKANAYGHGLEMAARAALTGGAELLVVAAVSEAFALRAAGIRAPILVVYPTDPEQVVDAVNEGIELSVGGRESVDATLRAWAACRDRSALMRLHVEVDTGMGRGGVPPEDLVEVVTRIDGEPATELAGVWSHLSDGSDPDRSAAQVARFEEALAGIAAIGRPLPVRHVAATEGLLVGTAPPYEMVRIGLAWYGELGLGVEPTPKLAGVADRLRPALRVVARPVRIADVDVATSIGYGGEWTANRPSRIATLPIGYADGIARSSWPGGCAVANGRRVPIVGRISMDSLSVDVTDAGEVTMDSEVVLLGAQDAERISVNEVARQRGTIPNEVLSTLGARLPRRYLGVDRLREPDS